MNLKDEEVRIKTHWRPTAGEPSSAWRRLWSKLLASRKDKPASTRHDADGEMNNANDTNVPDQ